jgi:hypothetical protein
LKLDILVKNLKLIKQKLKKDLLAAGIKEAPMFSITYYQVIKDPLTHLILGAGWLNMPLNMVLKLRVVNLPTPDQLSANGAKDIT